MSDATWTGYSFISNKVGLAIDNVVSYEHVLPNGTVTVVTAASNPELFWALKVRPSGSQRKHLILTMSLQ